MAVAPLTIMRRLSTAVRYNPHRIATDGIAGST